MTPIPVQSLADAIGGRVAPAETSQTETSPAEASSAVVSSIVIDSRKAKAGAAFVAIRGEQMDGHAFLDAAVANGAAAIVVDQPPSRSFDGVATIVVRDTRQALRDAATMLRGRLTTRCRVVGVAGSNGKTSTKHLIAAALGARLRGSASPKSFNNDIGVPLTIFDADPTQDFLVLELGTNHPGEIATLAQIARPDVCVITNCTAEHLEGLTDLDGVRRENASVIGGMSDAGTLAVLGDDPQLMAAVAAYRGRLVRFGFDVDNDLVADDVRVTPAGTTFTLDGRRVDVPMIGRHNALNALAAIAVARAFDIADDDSIAALAGSTKPDMRMDRLDVGGATILNDCYNANPASMRGAIETLLAFEPTGDGRRVAVLGEMREMGEHSERLHRELGALVASHGNAIARLVCVGPMARWTIDEAKRRDFPGASEHYETSLVAADGIKPGAGDVVLVKGSRGVRMEQIVDRLRGDVAWATSP